MRGITHERRESTLTFLQERPPALHGTSWFDSQLQLLRYCHWKLRKSRLTVSLTNLLAGCHLVSNVALVVYVQGSDCCFYCILEQISLLEQTKIDRAKNQQSFTSFVLKNAIVTKFSKPRKVNFFGAMDRL